MICMSNIKEIESHARVICINSEEVLEIIPKNCFDYLIIQEIDKKKLIVLVSITICFLIAIRKHILL